MKIQPETQQPAAAAEPAETTAAKAGRTPVRKAKEPAKRARKGDQIALSGPLAEQLQAEQEQRNQHVESIKGRLKAGTYQVSSREVAEKMLTSTAKRATRRDPE